MPETVGAPTRLDVIAGVTREAATAYRIVATRRDRTRPLGMADANHVAAFVAAQQRAMPNWQVEAHQKTFLRWISGRASAATGSEGVRGA